MKPVRVEREAVTADGERFRFVELFYLWRDWELPLQPGMRLSVGPRPDTQNLRVYAVEPKSYRREAGFRVQIVADVFPTKKELLLYFSDWKRLPSCQEPAKAHAAVKLSDTQQAAKRSTHRSSQRASSTTP